MYSSFAVACLEHVIPVYTTLAGLLLGFSDRDEGQAFRISMGSIFPVFSFLSTAYSYKSIKTSFVL